MASIVASSVSGKFPVLCVCPLRCLMSVISMVTSYVAMVHKFVRRRRLGFIPVSFQMLPVCGVIVLVGMGPRGNPSGWKMWLTVGGIKIPVCWWGLIVWLMHWRVDSWLQGFCVNGRTAVIWLLFNGARVRRYRTWNRINRAFRMLYLQLQCLTYPA